MMESAKTPTCGVYSDFLLHQAGIGNDLRMMLRELNELNIQIKYLSNGKPKMLKAINFLGVLLFGPKKVKDIDFCYSPHVLPRIYNVPHIVRIHDIFPLTNPYWFKLTSRIYFKLSMMTHKRSFFLFDSESTKQDFQKYFGNATLDRGVVIPCKIRKLEKNMFCRRCIACKEYDKIINRNFALAVGTIEPRKNYEFILNAWKQVNEKRKEKILLYVVGDKGWKTRKLVKTLKQSSNHVVWLEKICDSSLDSLYSRAEVFISASKAEGYNLPVQEAISYGLTAVVSSIKVHKELYSSSAYFFELDSQESFLFAIDQALDKSNNPNVLSENIAEMISGKTKLADALRIALVHD